MDILFKFPIKVSVTEVFRAISSEEQIRNWWTRDAKFQSRVGAVAEFGFGRTIMKMEVETIEPQKMVWKAVDGPDHWPGTSVIFELAPVNGGSVLRFSHIGFKESVREEVAGTTARWGFYLVSLKNYLENGRGQPNPEDSSFWSMSTLNEAAR